LWNMDMSGINLFPCRQKVNIEFHHSTPMKRKIHGPIPCPVQNRLVDIHFTICSIGYMLNSFGVLKEKTGSVAVSIRKSYYQAGFFVQSSSARRPAATV
jgi:hypothetical protein